MSDIKALLDYLLEHSEITARAASHSLGIDRLSARIFDMKHDYGEVILDRWMTVPKRGGKTARIKAYRISDEFKNKLKEQAKPKKPFPKLNY